MLRPSQLLFPISVTSLVWVEEWGVGKCVQVVVEFLSTQSFNPLGRALFVKDVFSLCNPGLPPQEWRSSAELTLQATGHRVYIIFQI